MEEDGDEGTDDDDSRGHAARRPAGYTAPQVVSASPSFGSGGGIPPLLMSPAVGPVPLSSPKASEGSRVQLLSPSGGPSAGARSFLDRFLLSVDERR